MAAGALKSSELLFFRNCECTLTLPLCLKMSFVDSFDNDPAFMASSEIMFFVRYVSVSL